jgi:hypothetical protein
MNPKKLLVVLVLASATTLTGCMDVFVGKVRSYGGQAMVTCYSGEKVIYKGKSTGKVTSPDNSDGYQFVAESDGRLKEVSGNCVIDYIEY